MCGLALKSVAFHNDMMTIMIIIEVKLLVLGKNGTLTGLLKYGREIDIMAIMRKRER